MMSKNDIMKAKKEAKKQMAILTADCKSTFVLDEKKEKEFKEIKMSKGQEKQAKELAAKISKNIRMEK